MADLDGSKASVQHVFIIGAKSIGQYGGFETFVDRLLQQHENDHSIKYHIACKANGDGYMDETRLDSITEVIKDAAGKVTEFTYRNAHVFKISCPNIGSAVAIYYDREALLYSIRYCEKQRIQSPIFYILTCRIGLFIRPLEKQIKSIGGIYILNPDGHEWMRAKWSLPVRKYWKWSEKEMVSCADLVICDSKNIEKYIKEQYRHTNTVYIAYGADVKRSSPSCSISEYENWLKENGLKTDGYYLIVGRLVPENNYETMIREFMKTKSSRALILITNKNEKYQMELDQKLHWSADSRIRFVGTVYDRELLEEIRENAHGYLHGHEVGGTNPSLLEALGSTDLNLLLDVGFNREVGEDTALYWTKEDGSLSRLIEKADYMGPEECMEFGHRAKARIQAAYSWELIANQYKKVWKAE